MSRQNRFMQFGALLCILLIHGTTAVYPDLSCHSGYDKSTSDKVYGQGLLETIESDCNEQKDECFKTCILRKHAVIENGGTSLKNEMKISDWLGMFIFDNSEVPKKIASQIVSNCNDLAKDAQGFPCEERTKLYECVEQAWAC